jgi:hypothetical protein
MVDLIPDVSSPRSCQPRPHSDLAASIVESRRRPPANAATILFPAAQFCRSLRADSVLPICGCDDDCRRSPLFWLPSDGSHLSGIGIVVARP